MKYSELLQQEALIKALCLQDIYEPTTIQKDVYEPIKAHKNIIARSETGSGKTLAYLLPIIEKINSDDRALYSVVLVPTYELAIQVNKQIELLATNAQISLRSAVIIGNGNINRQIEALKKKPHIIVGTAGRVLELIKLKKISAHTVKTIVIDEADKMMDKNNYQMLSDVRKCFMRDTQILLFSASMNSKATQLATEFVPDALIIKYQNKETIPASISHYYIMCQRKEKIETLRSVCSAVNSKKTMIFINTKYNTNEAFMKLTYHHYKVENLSKEGDKNERKNALERFRNGKSNYLLSTDLASRGLHINGVDCVINVNIPENPMDYLHRCGRCGRNNQKGICISIITPHELEQMKTFQKRFGITIQEMKLKNGKIV